MMRHKKQKLRGKSDSVETSTGVGIIIAHRATVSNDLFVSVKVTACTTVKAHSVQICDILRLWNGRSVRIFFANASIFKWVSDSFYSESKDNCLQVEKLKNSVTQVCALWGTKVSCRACIMITIWLKKHMKSSVIEKIVKVHIWYYYTDRYIHSHTRIYLKTSI